jgi:hypothetical protein
MPGPLGGAGNLLRLMSSGAILAAGLGPNAYNLLKANQTFISGEVVNAAGDKPEAGVWVIAETASLPTPFRKIVVTSDDGRFVVPDLPKGAYPVWLRGDGLMDSAPADSAGGG